MIKEPYLIAVDMDGTLLNSKKKVSFLTRHYLTKLNKKGHVIVLASGRPSRSLYSYYNLLKLNSPMICYNGAYCFSPKDKSFPTKAFEFPREAVKSLVKELKPYIKNIMCETDTEIWIDKEDKYLAKFFWYEGMKLHFGDISTTIDKDPMTFIVQTPIDEKDQTYVHDIVKKYKGLEARFWTASPYFELFFTGTSKGARVLDIASYYGIPKERIIVFGDADNDIEMFGIAGTSVVMKNGKGDKVRKNATMVSVKDNDHNGIYYTLKKYFKL